MFGRNRSLSLFAVLAVSWIPVERAAAQAPATAPRISIVLHGANRLMEDTQFMMALSPEGLKEWEDVKSFAEDIFFIGIDKTRPVRIDAIVGDGPTRYRPSFPVADEKDFLTNLEDFGIEQRKQATGYWELRDAFEGYLRIKDGYGSIGEQAGDVPATLPDPTDVVGPILTRDFDLAVEVVNVKSEVADRAARRADFEKNVRTELLAGVARLDDESKEDYELRRAGIGQQLEDLERYYADTARAVIGWDANTGTAIGKSSILLEPIPGSDLDAAVKLLGVRPSYFASVPRTDTAILSLRVNHPLDPLRQKHFGEFYALLGPALDARIDTTEKTAGEKAAAKQLSGLVVEMLTAGAKAGVADGFVEVGSLAAGANAGVAGIRSPNGKGADAIVQLLPAANSKIQVRMDVAKFGDVAVHEIALPLADMPDYVFLFGENPNLYVGTSEAAVWFSAGTNALVSLEKAVKLVDVAAPKVVESPEGAEATETGVEPTSAVEPVEPKVVAAPEAGTSAPFVDLFVKLKPWMEYRDRKAGAVGDEELRKIALAALANGDDSLSLKLSRSATGVTGELIVKEAVFRLVGRLMAKFSDENL